jgi:hypothetical protein
MNEIGNWLSQELTNVGNLGIILQKNVSPKNERPKQKKIKHIATTSLHVNHTAGGPSNS